MKKAFLLSFFLINLTTIFGQSFYISVDNPEPRVGEIVRIEVHNNIVDSLIFSSLDTNKFKQLGLYGSRNENQIIAKDTGTFIINPIKMIIQDRVYESNRVILKVLPALPETVGLWIRIVKNSEAYFVILEEYINAKIVTTNMGTTISEDQKFAELMQQPTPNIHYQIWGVQLFPINPKEWDRNIKTAFVFRTSMYKIECNDISKYHLEKSHVLNPPPRIEILNNTIKNWP